MKKKMMLTLAVLLAVILFAALMSFSAFAKDKPKHADGIWYYMPDFAGLSVITFPDYAGDPDKMFLSVPYTSEWTGVFTGSSIDYGLLVSHNPDLYPPVGAPMSFVGTTSFESVEVCGATGNLEMDTLGDRTDPFAEWRGTWVITSGTDGLVDLQGHGTFWGPGYLGGDEPGVIYYMVDALDGIDCNG